MKLMFEIFEKSPRRRPIRSAVKTEVYVRAKGKCERCGKKLKQSQGDFHHTRDPKIVPTAKTVEFLCPTCHRIYGHVRRTKTTEDLFDTETKRVTKRKKVSKRLTAQARRRKGKRKKRPKQDDWF